MLSSYLTMYIKYLVTSGIIYSIKKLKETKTDQIKRAFKNVIRDKELINKTTNRKASIGQIKEYPWGFKTEMNISGILSYKDFEKQQDYIKQVFRAKDVNIYNANGKAFIEVVTADPQELYFQSMDLKPTELLLGYNFKSEPIIADMKITPHVAIQGLSNSGKSKGIELTLMNLKGADIVLINTFKEDFTNIKDRRVNGYENILKFLIDLLVEQRQRVRPLYVVIDEANELTKDKSINKAIQDILAVGRHKNIYLIAIGQLMLKENCSYKNLFNVRVTFKMIEGSTIGAFLGVNVPDNKLMQQEFICYSDGIYRGKTYNYSF